MNPFSEVQEFVRTVREAASFGAVEAILSDATRRFQFDHFAMVQRGSGRPTDSPVRLSDYPAEWIALLTTGDYFVHDPVLVAVEKSVAPFAWDDLPSLLPMTRQQHLYMASAHEQGLSHGYTVPIHVPGEASGLCSFVTAGGRALPAESLPAAQYLACFAFEAARRLAVAVPAAGARAQPRLTQRQLDCVVLAAKGKSNWVAGKLLGLSPGTVHKYLEHAKRRYAVSSRTELVVRALYDGQLSFSDVLH